MRKGIAFTMILVVIIFLAPGIAFSQSKMGNTSNDLGFTIGLTEYQVKERVLNDIRHRGAFISGGLFYEKSKETSKQRFELYSVPFLGKVGSRYDPDKAPTVSGCVFLECYVKTTIVDTSIKYR